MRSTSLRRSSSRRQGNKLTISYDLAAVQKKRILDGERADVIILTRVMMDNLAKQNKLAPGNIVNVVSTPRVSLAARAGAPKPDLQTADAFKQTLLSAKSISYADPAKGGLERRGRQPRHRALRYRRADEI